MSRDNNNDLFANLKGARVLVTGAGVGIGAAIARRFGRCGAHVGVHYNSNHDRAKTLCDEICRDGGEASAFPCDLHDPVATEQLVDSFVEHFGGIDVLVNNAGACYEYNHFTKVSLDALTRTYELNITAPFLLSRNAFVAMQKEGKGGRIINISSTSVKFGGSEFNIHYAASKAALDSLTLGMSRAGAKDNILVNGIRCGVIDTGMREHDEGYSEERYQKRVGLVPLGRAGDPDEIARVALFLASSGSDYMTGQSIFVAGGD